MPLALTGDEWVVLLSAIVPVIVAWDAFFDHRWLWVRMTGAHSALFKVQDDLAYAEANKTLSQKRLDGLYQEFRKAVDETSEEWQQKRQQPAEAAREPK